MKSNMVKIVHNDGDLLYLDLNDAREATIKNVEGHEKYIEIAYKNGFVRPIERKRDIKNWDEVVYKISQYFK